MLISAVFRINARLSANLGAIGTRLSLILIIIEPFPHKEPRDKIIVVFIRLELRQRRAVLAQRIQSLFEPCIPSLCQMQFLQKITDAPVTIPPRSDFESAQSLQCDGSVRPPDD